ncbi:MAG TPA: DMT family protein [Flavobacteriales bacterium]|nr:DMT family protein [Flavobacteriales bacterium]
MLTIILLSLSNVFMTIAWYWHTKAGFEDIPMWKVIAISWGIALFEYCLMVPANRLGTLKFNAYELKTIQEALSITVFIVFAWLYLGQGLKWNYALGFLMMLGAVFVVFKKW